MGGPRENPADKQARQRERRLSSMERSRATQDNAAGLTSDLRAVYGLRNISMFSLR